jgi:hypothetical protein
LIFRARVIEFQTNLSSRPKRSEVEGPAVSPIKSHHPPLCHPDRSAAQWRDLLFFLSIRSDGSYKKSPPSPLSSRPERSVVEGSAVSLPVLTPTLQPLSDCFSAGRRLFSRACYCVESGVEETPVVGRGVWGAATPRGSGVWVPFGSTPRPDLDRPRPWFTGVACTGTGSTGTCTAEAVPNPPAAGATTRGAPATGMLCAAGWR